MNFLGTGMRRLADIEKLMERGKTWEEAKEETMERLRLAIALGLEVETEYKKIAEDMGVFRAKKTYMITIRPDETKVKFDEFKNDVDKFLDRKMFTEIHAASFEQKGESEEELGKGFHVHIVAATTCSSKAEVLRNTVSTFAKYTAANCIQVDLCQNPTEVVKKYLVDYESNDGHKEKTKEWDKMWRERLGLPGPGPIKSSEGPEPKVTIVKKKKTKEEVDKKVEATLRELNML